MDEQVRKAKAVIGIDQVHLLKHTNGEPEITEALLNQTTDWFSVATLKGSLEVAQDQLSKTMVHIDQSSMPIGISVEAGDFNISFNMPSLVSSNLSTWLHGKGTTKFTNNNKEGYGYDFTEELDDMVLVLVTKTGETFIFPNIQGAVTMALVDDVWVLQYSGAVLNATNEANKSVYILADSVTA